MLARALLLCATAQHVAGELQLHVHPTAGDDSHDGTSRATAFRTVVAARDAIRVRRAYHTGGATVFLHSGTHNAFVLDAELDSGAADFPIRYAAAPGAAPPPLISAGAQIPKAAWTAAGDDMPTGVVVADLTKLGLSDFGSLPHSGGQIDACDQLASQKMQLFHMANAMVLARYPNLSPDGDWKFLYATAGITNGFSIAAGANATRVLGWAKEEAPFVHGYWAWDWADSIQAIVGAKSAVDGVEVTLPTGQTSKKHARFFGLNLKSELDAPNEYYIENSTGFIYYYPSVPLEQWTEDPSVSVGEIAVIVDGTSHVTLEGIVVAHAKGTGISAKRVSDVLISNCTVFGHGANGVTIDDAHRSGIIDSHVYDVGCIGVTLSGGNITTLEPGLNFALRNRIHHMANFKRTYQPGLHWSGVNNTMSHNYISDGPHNCILGGGNEGPGVNCLFEYNTLDKCSYESSDTGAFYTCGQMANAFVNRGNELRHGLFKNIRNTEGSGVQGITIQAVYLDDQMSGWHIWNNTFYNCMTGTFIGGGEHNRFHDNYYQECDTAHHFDNRGMNWQGGAANCTTPTPCIAGDQPKKLGNCNCNPAAVTTLLNGPAGAEWKAKWPEVEDVFHPPCLVSGKGAVPCKNEVVDNKYCKSAKFIDATQASTDSWDSSVKDNVEVPCKYDKEPPAFGNPRIQ